MTAAIATVTCTTATTTHSRQVKFNSRGAALAWASDVVNYGSPEIVEEAGGLFRAVEAGTETVVTVAFV